MPPPQLPGDAPVANVVHPVKIRGFPGRGNDPGLFLHHGGDGLFGQGFDFHKPLFGHHRFDIRFTAVALTDIVRVRLRADEIAFFFQIGDHIFARLITILPFVLSAMLIDDSLPVHDGNDFQIVALSHGKIVGIGTGGDLHRARAEIHRHIVVGDDRYWFIHERQNDQFADFIFVARVVRMNGHGRIAQHRLRPGCGHDNVALAVGVGITDIPQETLIGLEFHFQVGNGRMTARTPVDDIVPLVNHIFIIKPHKYFPDRLGQAFIHGEAFAFPIAGTAQALELIDDDAAIFFLPFPDAGNEFFASQIVAGQAFFP